MTKFVVLRLFLEGSSLSAVATISFAYFLSMLSVATPCVSFVFPSFGNNFLQRSLLLSTKATDNVFAKCKVNFKRLSFFLILPFPFGATFWDNSDFAFPFFGVNTVFFFHFGDISFCSLRISLLEVTLPVHFIVLPIFYYLSA